MKDKFIGTWIFPHTDSLLEQVARTDKEDMQEYANDVINKLNINSSDIVLDVCCGNGILTKIVSNSCNSILGVDFSHILIETAKKLNSGKNIQYFEKDAIYLDQVFEKNYFDKIYCHSGIQYFDKMMADRLISAISKVIKKKGKIFFCAIPDKSKKFFVLNTKRNKLKWMILKVIRKGLRMPGEDSMGYWWDQIELIKICEKYGFVCDILPDSLLPNMSYRFDILLIKR